MAQTQDSQTVPVPGTIHLLDLQPTGDGGEILLRPAPSSDPNDPLNWSRGRKYLAISQVYLYVFTIGIATAVQYSVLTQISEDTGITLAQLNTGTGLQFLFCGWGCLIWQPIALTWGRRGAYIISGILCIGPMIWTPYTRNYGQWYAARVLLGIFCAPVESLPEVSVPDLFFAHERGTFMAIYAFVLFGANFLAPFFAGFINDGVGWHWVMYFGAIVLAVGAVLNYFLMEDTIYFRSTAESDLAPLQESHVDETFEPESKTNKEQEITTTQASPESSVDARFFAPDSYWKRLHIFIRLPGRPTPYEALMQSWLSLKILVYFPNVVWAGLLYGTNLSWYNILNATSSSVLSAPPYNFPATMVGVSYLSPLIGAGIACFWSGSVADRVMMWLARRNGGLREPEQRLWTLVLAALFSTGGLILWGVGASRSLPFMGPIFGLAMTTFGVVCGGSFALSYAVDCFKDITGESMISVIIIRNTLGFAFNYAITPWIDAQGLEKTFITVGMLSFACSMSFIIVVIFGKQWRKFSAARYWKYVDARVIHASH